MPQAVSTPAVKINPTTVQITPVFTLRCSSTRCHSSAVTNTNAQSPAAVTTPMLQIDKASGAALQPNSASETIINIRRSHDISRHGCKCSGKHFFSSTISTSTADCFAA